MLIEFHIHLSASMKQKQKKSYIYIIQYFENIKKNLAILKGSRLLKIRMHWNGMQVYWKWFTLSLVTERAFGVCRALGLRYWLSPVGLHMEDDVLECPIAQYTGLIERLE